MPPCAECCRLVYVAAFAPDEGTAWAVSLPDRNSHPVRAASGPINTGFLWIAQESFRESFGQDLDESEALVMAVAQKADCGALL